MDRPRPVLIYGALVAGLQALLSAADLGNLMPQKTIAILNVVLIVLLAVGGALFVQTKVTPLSDPQASDGRALVPSPPAKVPTGTDPARLDATEDDPGPLDAPTRHIDGGGDDPSSRPDHWK